MTVTSLVVLSRIDTRAWRSPFILSLPAILSSRIGESCIYIDKRPLLAVSLLISLDTVVIVSLHTQQHDHLT